MSASLATLNGARVLTCAVSLPAYGAWWAEVEISPDSDDVLTGAATLVVDDLTLKGTITNGGASQARQRYRVVGGGAGWCKTIAAKSYVNDLGVKSAIILRDAALACGEMLGTVPPADVAGPAYTRENAPARRTLEALYPRGWYVDESGITQIGRRPVLTYTGAAVRIDNDPALGRYELAPDAGGLGALLPGVVVDGVEAVDVEIVIGDDGKLRVVLWARRANRAGDPLASSLARFVDELTAPHRFFATWEYRIVARSGERLDLQATRVSSGMPDLRAVRIRPGVAGVRTHPMLGSLVEVAFLNGDPSQPRVVAFDDQDGAGFIADEIAMQAGATGSTPTEHATSVEALAVALQMTLTAVGGALGAPGAGVTALAADATFAAGILAAAAAAPVGPATKSAIATLLAAKLADTDGTKPGLGWPAVRGG